MTEPTKPENPPAFPCQVGHIECKHPTGMTLRDYFAAKAMQGWLSTYGDAIHPARSGPQYMNQVVQDAYALADAMLSERAKGGEAK